MRYVELTLSFIVWFQRAAQPVWLLRWRSLPKLPYHVLMEPSPFRPWVLRYWHVIILLRPLMARGTLVVEEKMVAGEVELSGAVSM